METDGNYVVEYQCGVKEITIVREWFTNYREAVHAAEMSANCACVRDGYNNDVLHVSF